MTVSRNLERALRAIASLPDDGWGEVEWDTFIVSRREVEAEVRKLDRATGRKAERKARPTVVAVNRKPAEDPELTAAKKVVRARSGGDCEARTKDCEGRATQAHHKAGRGWEGCHDPALLVDVCGMGNTSGCHGWIHADRDRAEAAGLLLPWGPPMGLRPDHLADPVPTDTCICGEDGWEPHAHCRKSDHGTTCCHCGCKAES